MLADTMIERVARLIFGVVAFANPSAFHPSFEVDQEIWIRTTRAATEAMREPTVGETWNERWQRVRRGQEPAPGAAYPLS